MQMEPKRVKFDIFDEDGKTFIKDLETDQVQQFQGVEYFMYSALAADYTISDLENSTDDFLAVVWELINKRRLEESSQQELEEEEVNNTGIIGFFKDLLS